MSLVGDEKVQEIKTQEIETATVAPDTVPLTTTEHIILADEPEVDSGFDAAASAPADGDESIQFRLSSGSKETTFMKLKNKIRQLETNLNLSSA